MKRCTVKGLREVYRLSYDKGVLRLLQRSLGDTYKAIEIFEAEQVRYVSDFLNAIKDDLEDYKETSFKCCYCGYFEYEENDEDQHCTKCGLSQLECDGCSGFGAEVCIECDGRWCTECWCTSEHFQGCEYARDYSPRIVSACYLQAGNVFSYTGSFKEYHVKSDAEPDPDYPGRVVIQVKERDGMLIRLQVTELCEIRGPKNQ